MDSRLPSTYGMKALSLALSLSLLRPLLAQRILLSNSMTDHPPTLSQIASTITRVTDNVARARRRFGLWRTFTRGQIKRGEEYLDASHTIFHLCRPLMYKGDKVMVRNTFKRAKDAKARLKPSNVSKFQRLRDAKQFKSLCKETFEVVTVQLLTLQSGRAVLTFI
ncbi:hypothetical protein EDB86DRAFT_2022462 [Lactarius hatsudake]|nr:hypothetical protein EDB86DRAFT_2022462 [Lactarius hatsudake]